MEISAALDDLAFPDGEPIQVVGTERLPPGKAAEETGKTFEENARIKVESCARRARRLPPGERPRWVLADDSGLVVDALDGAPGVRSARYAGPHATDQDNNRKLLQALKNIEPGRRSAKFVCVVACVDLAPGESGASQTAEPLPLLYAQGECRGEILTEAEGHDGFGYDPLFFLPELGKTMAQLTRKEKNEVSHRGRALKALKEGHWRKMRA
jgi:XTP/dITP diphosphohydrolase